MLTKCTLSIGAYGCAKLKVHGERFVATMRSMQPTQSAIDQMRRECRQFAELNEVPFIDSTKRRGGSWQRLGTLKVLHDAMHYFNRFAAPNSECVAWGDFVADCYHRYDMAPWDERAADVEPVQDFMDYWLDVANQRPGSEYDETGNRIDA